MFKSIEGLPADVLAIEASGEITHQDYRDTLIPKAEAMMAKGPIKMLYVIGPDFTGFDLQALWDDSAFGFSHWHDFSQIALVTDHAWMGGLVTMFTPFFHGAVRLFRLAQLSAAKEWITAPPAGARP
jgi:hypothetical protein